MEDADIAERYSKTVAIVEATLAETHFLWREYSNQSDWCEPRHMMPKYKWVPRNPGYWEEIGSIKPFLSAPLPVFISVLWNEIEGQLVLFWELTSMLQDHSMVEDYFKKKFNGKLPMYDNGQRIAMTNAMNFHLAIEAVKEANELQLQKYADEIAEASGKY